MGAAVQCAGIRRGSIGMPVLFATLWASTAAAGLEIDQLSIDPPGVLEVGTPAVLRIEGSSETSPATPDTPSLLVLGNVLDVGISVEVGSDPEPTTWSAELDLSELGRGTYTLFVSAFPSDRSGTAFDIGTIAVVPASGLRLGPVELLLDEREIQVTGEDCSTGVCVPVERSATPFPAFASFSRTLDLGLWSASQGSSLSAAKDGFSMDVVSFVDGFDAGGSGRSEFLVTFRIEEPLAYALEGEIATDGRAQGDGAARVVLRRIAGIEETALHGFFLADLFSSLPFEESGGLEPGDYQLLESAAGAGSGADADLDVLLDLTPLPEPEREVVGLVSLLSFALLRRAGPTFRARR